MRKIVWSLMVFFVFAIPWEYSLDLGAPLGNVARIAGLLVLVAAIPTVLLAGSIRTPGPLQWLVLVFYLWFCCTGFWTIEAEATVLKLRAYLQELMIVWLVWELADHPRDLKTLIRAYVAGSWVLAILTVLNLGSAEAIAAGQIRFAATGQDPNDIARFLDLGFPMAALLLSCKSGWSGRLLALGYLPLGLIAVLLTASRGGFVAAVAALTGCCFLLLRIHSKAVFAGLLLLPVIACWLWLFVPHETFERLETIPAQLRRGDLNQRLNIWDSGQHAFVQAPFLGSGAGSFVYAAGLNPLDTAHNTVLSILVSGGLCAFFLAVAIVVVSIRSTFLTEGPLFLALVTAMLVWSITSLIATVEENRTTWLLLGLISVAGRFSEEEPELLATCFPSRPTPRFSLASEPGS